MEDKQYELKSCGQENYLILKAEMKEIPLFELEYLERRKIGGLLFPEIMLQNGTLELWYKLTGCQSLRTLLEVKRFGKDELIVFLKSVYEFSNEIECYLLNPLGILVDPDAIFYNSEQKQFLFCYYPQGKSQLKDGLLKIVEDLLTLVDYKDSEMVSLLYRTYEILSQPNVSYRSLALLENKAEDNDIDKIMKNESETVEKESVKTEKITLENFSETVTEEENNFLNIKYLSKDFWMTEIPNWWKNMLALLQKETKKRVTPYLDLKPVIIRPEEEKLETPTVLLTEARFMRETGEVTFCLKSSEEGGESIPLTKERIIIGKNYESADAIINDITVSRIHAFITKEEESYYIEDLNSLNGTFLNGERLSYKEKASLRENDIIGIGGKNFCFCPL